jgi:putative redox protein
MPRVLHVARAVGSTSSALPAYRVEVTAGAHQLAADEPASNGGGDTAPPPFGLLLSGLAACTATTLRMYAERKGWQPISVEVDVRYDVADDDERSIVRTITLPADTPLERRDRLAAVAERTPVTIAVRAGTRIDTTVLPPPVP